MKQALLIAASLLLLALAFVSGRITGRNAAISRVKPQTDTLYHTDTITRFTPVSTRVYVRDTIRLAVRDTIRQQDTLYIELPREVREYRDTAYYARVTGYRPELEYIETYNTEKIVTSTIIQDKRLKPRYSLGISAGYGLTMDEFKGVPYVGISVQYNILSWDFK